MTARLLRPLNVLSQTARRIGEGDLEARARVASNDEIAQLSGELTTMADRLQQYRKSSLGELLEAQQASQAAIDSLPDPVLIVGTDGTLLHVNVAAESVLKVDLDHGGKEALLDAGSPWPRDVVERVRHHVVSGKGPYSPRSLEESLRLATSDGDRHFLPRATPALHRGRRGRTHHHRAAGRHPPPALRRVLKNDMVATVAHEFRTLLTSLQMAIHLCAEQVEWDR